MNWLVMCTSQRVIFNILSIVQGTIELVSMYIKEFKKHISGFRACVANLNFWVNQRFIDRLRYVMYCTCPQKMSLLSVNMRVEHTAALVFHPEESVNFNY